MSGLCIHGQLPGHIWSMLLEAHTERNGAAVGTLWLVACASTTFRSVVDKASKRETRVQRGAMAGNEQSNARSNQDADGETTDGTETNDGRYGQRVMKWKECTTWLAANGDLIR